MSWIRSLARAAMIRTGAPEKQFRRELERSGNRVIFLFHRVLPRSEGNDFSPAGMVVSVETFRQFLDWLPRRFDLPTPAEFLGRWPERADRPTAMITFDDGWLDVVVHALPEMTRRGIGGLSFVSPRFVDSGEIFWPERLIHLAAKVEAGRFREITGTMPPALDDADGVESLLSGWKRMDEGERNDTLARLVREGGGGPDGRRVADWDELRELQEGGVKIGSHGLNHQLLTTITEEEARREIEESRSRIAGMLGSPPNAIAYPNGDRNDLVRRLSREAGYEFGFSLQGDWADRYDLPRINLHEDSMRSAGHLVWAIGRSG